MSDVIDKGEKSLNYLIEALRANQYNCECQVGGPDAMSIDTDFMNQAVKEISAGWAMLREIEWQYEGLG